MTKKKTIDGKFSLDLNELKTFVNKIMRATKPVAFELTERYAVTGRGAPS